MKKLTIKQKLNITVQALEDIQNPIAKFQRELPEGTQLNGHMCCTLAGDPQLYKDIAKEALNRIKG